MPCCAGQPLDGNSAFIVRAGADLSLQDCRLAFGLLCTAAKVVLEHRSDKACAEPMVSHSFEPHAWADTLSEMHERDFGLSQATSPTVLSPAGSNFTQDMRQHGQAQVCQAWLRRLCSQTDSSMSTLVCMASVHAFPHSR